MILSGTKCVTSYDPRDGRLHWIIDGHTEQFVASPVFSEKTGWIYITGGYPDHHILAIDLVGPSMALVKVKCQMPPRYFTDLLSFLKVDGKWEDAMRKSLAKPKPKGRWPKAGK